ncbi:OmpA family protein [Winogradskyella ludwigii]|jgi:outer membrane protein OmpA-like peptidoglycan-associated protein/tetratricopeptide (TPR) repeat protein|uniref:OmpA family protein n=1 Tax=Winogradskyella ludwigii TaxID=2686076 RepID=UPI0015CB50C4|nr:OmpA family protein [Winogradskyella ludwigii]
MKIKILALVIILSSSFSFAQTKLADKFFENYGYVKAIELYEKAVDKGDKSAHVLTRLGDAYYNNSNSEKAAYWYNEALTEHSNIEAEYIYKYIQSLRSVGKYEEADVWFKKLSDAQQGDSRLKGYNPDEVDIFDKLTSKNDDLIVTIENLPFNSENSDFGSYVFNNTLYFASANSDDKKVYNWNKEPFLDILQIELKDEEDGTQSYGTPTEIEADKINTNYHEASIAITNDGKTMYFTRDNTSKRNRLKYDKEGTTHLKLYKATLVDEQWSDVVELPFNDELFSTGHPALSPDNKTLYFVSDREGGIGQTDIYSVVINSDGTYGTPENLGDTINTEGREMFPYISNDGTFYFSSDGHLNLGLLDIFKSNILTEEATSEPINLGAPFNSGYDDFAYFINSETKKGFFSSNRPGGKGSDDIYSYTINECKQVITGTAKEEGTDIILSGVTVQLIDETGKIIEEVTTTEDGMYTFDVDCGKPYTVLGSKPDYKDDKKSITTDKENEKVNTLDLSLSSLIKNNQIVINPIFFDFDKSNIRTDAEYELENIVDVLRKHPEMVIKIESHTDSRGRDRYNLKLSDRRAKSTRDYLLSRDIATNRIESAIGYGETQLLNDCGNNSNCTAEEHQLNRRSYFYIIDQE